MAPGYQSFPNSLSTLLIMVIKQLSLSFHSHSCSHIGQSLFTISPALQLNPMQRPKPHYRICKTKDQALEGRGSTTEASLCSQPTTWPPLSQFNNGF